LHQAPKEVNAYKTLQRAESSERAEYRTILLSWHQFSYLKANAEHFTAALASECIIEGQVNGAIFWKPSEQKAKEEKAERMERPGGARKKQGKEL
jgi:hypothetical protein